MRWRAPTALESGIGWAVPGLVVPPGSVSTCVGRSGLVHNALAELRLTLLRHSERLRHSQTLCLGALRRLPCRGT
jgi:hypothetical protein